MKTKDYTYNKKQHGFSLWELSIVMLIMIGLFVALVNVMPFIVKRENVEVDNQVLVTIDRQLLGFIATYNRLPCPASTNSGLEDCLASSGSVPYKTIGLNEDYAGVGSIPVKYAVFRNTTSSADLAQITDLFNPTDAHGTVTTLNNVNGLDFCTALASGKASTFSANYAHIVLPDGSTNAVPYVVVTAGMNNADGIADVFDGRNSTPALDFEAPNTIHTSNYDDTVYSKTFDELAITLECDTAQASLNLMADGKATHTENLAQAENLKDGATLAGLILAAQITISIANTAMAAFTLAAAITTLAAASALLAAAIASCVILVGCALIPVYTAGVIASTVAIVAAGVSVAANVAAIIAQAVAIGLIIDVAVRAGATITVPEGTTDPVTGTTTTNNDLGQQLRDQANKLIKDAADKVIDARNDINAARSGAVSIRNRFNTYKSQAATLVGTNAAVNDATFTFYTSSANTQAQTNLNQADSAVNNLNSAKGDADNAVNALGAAVVIGLLFNPVVTYPNANFPLAESHLSLAEPKMNTAATQFTNLANSYLTIKNRATNARDRIIAIRNALPTLPNNATAAQINARNAYLAVLNDAQNKAQNIINTMNATKTIFISDLIDRRDDTIDAIAEINATINDIINNPVIDPSANPPIPNPYPLVLNPPFVTQQDINNQAAQVNLLYATRTRLQTQLDEYNAVLAGPFGGFLSYQINALADDIDIELGRIQGALGRTTEAKGTISSAIDAKAQADNFDNNTGGGLPTATTTLLQQAAGVDDILNAADLKGAER